MARVATVTAVLFSLLGCIASPPSHTSVADAEQLLMRTIVCNCIEEVSCNFALHIPNVNFTCASTTRRRHLRIQFAINHTMPDPSRSTTDVLEVTCICDTSTITAGESELNVCVLFPPSAGQFRREERSAKELLASAGEEKICSACTATPNPPLTVYARKYVRKYAR